jgi:hypothetical protein
MPDFDAWDVIKVPFPFTDRGLVAQHLIAELGPVTG